MTWATNLQHSRRAGEGGQWGRQAGTSWTLEQASQAINYAMQISTQCSIAFLMARCCSPPSSCCCPLLCLLATHATVQQMNEVSLSLCVVICRRFVAAAAAAAGAIRTSMRVGSSETDPNLPERSLRLPRQESRHQQQR